MAHQLEIKKDGTASMFSSDGLTPWHGLGTVVEGKLNAEDALKAAGLDWTVEKRPVWQLNGGSLEDGQFKQIPDRFSNVRTSDEKSLGIVSSDYHVFQNEESFSFLNEITDTGTKEAVFSTAGALFGGTRTFVTLQIGEGFTVADQDAHNLYLMVTNSHDGSQALQASVTPIRAVCNNTVTLGLAQARTKWSLRHKSDLQGKIATAREALEMAIRYEDAFEKEVQKLLEVEITKTQFYRIVDDLIPESKNQHNKDVDLLMNIWENEPTVAMGGGEGNGWGAFNAITYFTDHGKNYRTPESRFKSVIGTGVGSGYAEAMRPKAQKMILALA